MNAKHHNKKNTLKLIVAACFLLVLSACSDNDDTNTVTTTETVTELPGFIQDISALTDGSGGKLKAYISTDGGKTFKEMEVDRSAGNSKIELKLNREEYKVVIKFEYTDGKDTVLLATSRILDIDLLSNDNASIELEDSDYDNGNRRKQVPDNDGTFISGNYDFDGDDTTNLQEIINKTDPIVFTPIVKPNNPIVSINIIPNSTTITIDKPTISLIAEVTLRDGDTQNFTTSGQLFWKSENTATASVSDAGVVTGLKIGTTNITAELISNPTIKSSAKVEIIAAATVICKLDGISQLGKCKLE